MNVLNRNVIYIDITEEAKRSTKQRKQNSKKILKIS